MRIRAFSMRNAREMLRDPVSYIFTLGMPVAMLLLYRIIAVSVEKSAGEEAAAFFALENLMPGVAVFSFGFTMLNTALLLSKDRSSAFITRLYISPLKTAEYVIGYSVPQMLFSLLQILLCFCAAFLMGMRADFWDCAVSGLVMLPSVWLYVGLGLLIGTLLNDKAAPPVSSILVTASSLIGGVWFSPALMGEQFEAVARIFPFVHGVEAAREALLGHYAYIPIGIVLAWTAVIYAGEFILFRWKIRRDHD